MKAARVWFRSWSPSWSPFWSLSWSLAGSLLVGSATPAWAADSPPTAAEFARLQAEVAKLQQDLREQKQLLLNVMQAEQQRYDVLLQLVRSGSGGGAMPSPVTPSAGSAPMPVDPSGPAVISGAGSITGRVALPPGISEAYVYVEGLRGGPGRGKTVEIRQKDKQFSPQVTVIPVGTKLIFPNMDTIFHNVFSNTPGSAFDLGSVKGGERSRPVLMSRPGHLEVFCNIHSKMRADVLVVPGGHFSKVDADGSFTLGGIPAGARKVVLWAPGVKPVSQTVEVTSSGARISFTAQKEPPRPHLNKVGQAYGSYDE